MGFFGLKWDQIFDPSLNFSQISGILIEVGGEEIGFTSHAKCYYHVSINLNWLWYWALVSEHFALMNIRK